MDLRHEFTVPAPNDPAFSAPPGFGTRPRTRTVRVFSSSTAVMSVSMNPGATVPTAIPSGASATASDWPMAFIAAFDAP